MSYQIILKWDGTNIEFNGEYYYSEDSANDALRDLVMALEGNRFPFTAIIRQGA